MVHVDSPACRFPAGDGTAMYGNELIGSDKKILDIIPISRITS